MPKDQAPATIPADSSIRRLYLLALIAATKRSQGPEFPTLLSRLTRCFSWFSGKKAPRPWEVHAPQTAMQIAPVLTKEMMATPTISLAMMSLMRTLARDENAAMKEPRAALMRKLEDVATKEWLKVLRDEK